ncbi:MAG: vanadium-dependent haloperoxidase [Pseudomonadota bacterium]
MNRQHVRAQSLQTLARLCLTSLAAVLLLSCVDTVSEVRLAKRTMGVATQWNEEMLVAIRSGTVRPTVITREMFIASVAMYDAWTAYDATATPYALLPSYRRPAEEHTVANQQAAVSHAAFHALTRLYPDHHTNTGRFDAVLASYALTAVTDTAGDSPASVGYLAAMAALANRDNDLSNAENNYVDVVSTQYPALYTPSNSADPTAATAIGQPGFDPNRWTPIRVPNGTRLDVNGFPEVDDLDPTTYDDQTFLTPHWGAVRPFALSSGDQFRPDPPPQYGSSAPYTDGLGNTMTNDQAWHQQVDEVLAYSANLNDEHKVIAEFWADGPRSESPPGHWNQLAHGVCIRDYHDIGEEVRLYFALNAALLDAGIATWEAKRAYDYIRPVSGIKHKYTGTTVAAWGGPDLGVIAIDGADWRPYQDVTFVTPPFAEYTSGHSGFSRAAAEVLTAFTGTAQFYDGTTTTLQDTNGDGLEDLLGEHIQHPNTNLFESSPATTVTLRWNTFYDAADEAGLSRLYGGIHIQDGDLRGRAIGESVGKQAYALAEQYWSGHITR